MKSLVLYDDKYEKTSETFISEVFLEAQTGFEPVNQGVADPRLTAWLLRRTLYYIIIFSEKCKHFSKMTPTGIEPVLPP